MKLQFLSLFTFLLLIVSASNTYADKPRIKEEVSVNGFIIPQIWFDAYHEKYVGSKVLKAGIWEKRIENKETLLKLRNSVIKHVIFSQHAAKENIKANEITQPRLDELAKELGEFDKNDKSFGKAKVEITQLYFLSDVYHDEIRQETRDFSEIDDEQIEQYYQKMVDSKDPSIINLPYAKAVFIAGIEDKEDALKAVKDIREGKSFIRIGRKLDGTFDLAYDYNNVWRPISKFGNDSQTRIKATKKGEVSEPYRDMHGWYILKVLDKKVVKKIPLDRSLRKQIKKKLLAGTKKEYDQKILKKADVRINGVPFDMRKILP